MGLADTRSYAWIDGEDEKNMNHRNPHGPSLGLAVLLCGFFIGLPVSALATKSTSKKCEPQSDSHMMAAAVPKESRLMFSRISGRRIHGINSLHQSPTQRSVRRSLTRLNNSRALLAQQEQTLDSSRIRLIDGDTFAYGTERIRIQGFNAAERSDVGGLEATERLEKLLHQGRVTMIRKATDIYGRIVAEVFVDHHNVADLLKLDAKTTH